MKMESITKKLYECFNDMGVPTSALEENANLLKDLGLDSLDVTDLILRLETIFEINIPDSDWTHLQTIKDIKQYLMQAEFELA
jgi:acyl carrier protein